MDLLQLIKERLPELKGSKVYYEGSRIVIYTKNTDLFLKELDKVKELVMEIKKRIEIRIDPSLLLPPQEAEKKIREILPKETEIKEIYFEPEFSRVMIYARYPSIGLSEKGKYVRKIREETLWNPVLLRADEPESKHIKAVRKMLHQYSSYRKKFLHQVGKNIYLKEFKGLDYIRISCLGSGREVGRSCFLLQTPNTKILLDCGISPSLQAKPYPYFDAPEFDLNELDAVVITHAHLDHCGLVPYLYKMGYRGPLYCTEPTRELMVLLLLDSLDIMQKTDAKVIYNSNDIKNAIKHCIPIEYSKTTDIANDVRITFENAGHILGSSIVHFHFGHKDHNLVYTGDLKYSKTNLLNPAYTRFARVDSLIIESTYGGREDIMPSLEESEAELIRIIKETLSKKGKVIIPSFGVGRAQEIMLILEKYKEELDNPIVYIDGMIWDATAIHSTYCNYLSREIFHRIMNQKDNPFLCEIFKQVGSKREREKVLEENEPYIVLTTSGMLQGGPVLEYLKSLAHDEKNALIFVGYQAYGTPGYQIQKGDRRIEIGNEPIDINLKVYSIQGLSGHSDRKQLLSYIKHLRTTPKTVMVVHGEENKCLSLRDAISRYFRSETYAPRNLDVVRLK